ncbi:hypothetical protein GH714_034157 [Hevea brasiliensis]|uniref:Uncharacterized protein n=1 Tax=Hevea brasiliensis TaxID=3981 RepID=A0A6A6LLM2_HEVBR|nr:hypothetical protein GH714_034157 [Hevea brasiliensis]
METPTKIGMLESFMKNHQNSLKSLFQRKRSSNSSEDGAFDSPGISPRPIPQLSPLANSVVSRCSKILGVPTHELQHHFDIELPESVKQLFTYARNFLEFCSYQALNSVTRRPDYLSDKDFRRLTYDMMLAWEAPVLRSIRITKHKNSVIRGWDPCICERGREIASPSNRLEEDEDGPSLFYSSSTNMAVQVDDTSTVGREAFARIAPACAVVADVMTVHNLFDALTSSSGDRLHFLIYDKYLHSLDKIIRAAKNTPGNVNLQLAEGEIILDVDGTVPTQPILQHVGISAWPGRLTLTNSALYFESLGVGLYDKAVRYDLATDMKQVIKPELTGPLGARLFDKAVMYKSASVGDMILQTLLSRLALLNITASPRSVEGFAYAKQQPKLSPVALLTLVRLGFPLQNESNFDGEEMATGDLCAGETNPLEIAVKQSVSDIGRAEAAQATVDKVKVEGIDTNVAVMKELLFPVIELASRLQLLASWEDPFKSIVSDVMLLCFFKSIVLEASVWSVTTLGWTRYMLPFIFICSAVFMFLRRHFNRKEPVEAFKVRAPPNKNAVEQLLTLQEAITQVEALIQSGNIILLKIRALLIAVLPQATERIALLLVLIAAMFAFVPLRHLFLLVFLEAFTREMPYRKESSDRWRRRLREWWNRIPAAPVQLIKLDENKKKK